MLIFEVRYNFLTAREFTHNPPLCEIIYLFDFICFFMADITLHTLTPRHFYESVKLLKQTEHKIMFGYDTVEIRFFFEKLETFEETQVRFEKMEHFKMFLQELVNSSVPVDLEEFIKQYRYQPKRNFFRK